MSEPRKEYSWQPSGSFKDVLLVFLLVISIILMALIFLELEFQNRNLSTYIQTRPVASEQQLRSHSVVKQTLAASQCVEQAFIDLERTKHRFDHIFDIQKNGRERLAASPPIATWQLLLGQCIENDLNCLLAAGENVSSAVERFQRDMALSHRILGYAPRLFQVQLATNDLVQQGDEVQTATDMLLNAYANPAPAGWAPLPETPGLRLGFTVVYVLGAVVLIVLVVVVLIRRQESQRRLDGSERRMQETEEQNRRNQEAILRLLDEMGDLAEGDLTVQATVTEDITGAIADSINYAIEALRDLVTTINNTSERVASAARETRSVAESLAKSSEAQARQIDSASKTVTQMAKMMDKVSAKAASSSEVAEKSVGIAHQGGDRVRRTIQGMDAIREHIQETSKRIKRLGESSQEIGDIVALINDIADQTNILALNAAIQASSAGEAGRGFAVVADEVQRLAERAGNATKRIEALVKTTQADTNEAIISMEKSTSEVVNGAGLAEKAGESLEEIEAVSGRLAELINDISRAAHRVSEMGSQVSAAMVAINEITGQTTQASLVTASSIKQLNQLAQEMQQSVAGFRLPRHAGDK